MGALEKAVIRIGRGGQDLGRVALAPHFEDGIRERAPDIDRERDPAGVSWLHEARLYRTASRSWAGKKAMGGPNATLARGFGVSVTMRRDAVAASPGSFGWDGGFGTSRCTDPHENMVAILLIQRLMTSPITGDINADFWTLAYQAIDD